jgi:hypothetical protein
MYILTTISLPIASNTLLGTEEKYKSPLTNLRIFEDNLKDITAEDWEEHYPGRTHVTVTDHHSLKGFYNDKAVRWSKTQTCWVYGNNKPVEFPTESPDDSSDEGAVTAILAKTE